MILKEAIAKSAEYLKKKDIPTHRLDAELILAHLLKIDRVQLYVQFDRPLGDQEKSLYRDMIVKRSQGLPVAYLLKKKGFFRDDFFVDERVLIPRPETELLVEQVLALTTDSSGLRLADWGTGSGCVGLSLKKHSRTPLQVTLVDASPVAIEVAKENADRLGGLEVAFVCSRVQDLPETQKFDVIVANPPYIAESDLQLCPHVKKYEPSQALFSAADGFADIAQWSAKAQQLLSENGFFVTEHGAGQGPQTEKLLRDLGFKTAKTYKDLAGLDRFTVAQK